MFRKIATKILDWKPNMYSKSVALNLLGAQLYRTLFFYLRRTLRVPKRVHPAYSQYLRILERDGIVAIPNFFPEATFKQIQEEYRSLSPHFTRDGSAIPIPHTDRLNILDPRVSASFREYFLNNPLLKSVSRAFLNRNCNLPTRTYLTRIYCNEEELALPQNGGTNNLHFDAPLRVFKAFYYLSDTSEKNAALHYCVGSTNRSSLKRLLFEYKLSIRYARNKWNPDHQGEYLDNEPWVKITDDEIRAHGLVEKVMAVRANTMVLVDVGGFHKRGGFSEAGTRETVEINYRNAETLRNDLHFFLGRRV